MLLIPMAFRKNIMCVGIFLFSTMAWSQNSVGAFKDIQKIKRNRIKSVTKWCYLSNLSTDTVRSLFSEFDTAGRVIKEISYANTGEETSAFNYLYDDFGDLILLEWVDPFIPSIDSKEVYTYDRTAHTSEKRTTGNNEFVKPERTVCRYNREGRLLEEMTWINDTIADTRNIYRYNRKGLVQEKIILKLRDGYIPRSNCTYKYDRKNRLIKEVHFQPEGELYYSVFRRYDDREHSTELLTVQGEVSSHYKHWYDKDNDEIKWSNLNSGFVFILKYDSNKNLTESLYYDEKGKLTGIHKYTYEYR